MVIFILTIFLFVLYAGMMIFYWLGWRSLPDVILNDKNYSTTISVIIAARNEENNIGNLLEKLQQQTYPEYLFEVIVVNDHSTDDTAAIVKKFPLVRLIDLKTGEANSFKKKAIEEGIAEAKNDLIVTTDADCSPQYTWLESIAGFKQKTNSLFIAAPVILDSSKANTDSAQEENELLDIFQQLDFLILQGITAVSVSKKIFSMCNGANLAYDKNIFYEVDGFKSIDKVASGDDMLLMQKVRRSHPSQVAYLKSKSAIVFSKTELSWKNFFNQRLRWASKARMYNELNIFLVQFLVYIFNLLFLVLFIASFWEFNYFILLLILWIAKTLVELPFVNSVATYFNKRHLVKWFLFLQPVHIVYTIVVGLLSQFVNYKWKDRRVR